MGFHEIRFPLDIALGSRGGPVRRTEIVTLGSGREARNARWAHSRRRYDAGYGVKSITALQLVVAFFEERRGRLHGFRWRDRLDDRSCTPGSEPQPTDQMIGTGDGVNATYQLIKRYGESFAPYDRIIHKPVAATARLAVAGVEVHAGTDFDIDETTGLVTFRSGQIPPSGAPVTAGYYFDVPVRFDADELDIDLSAFEAGDIPRIPLIEIIP